MFNYFLNKSLKKAGDKLKDTALSMEMDKMLLNKSLISYENIDSKTICDIGLVFEGLNKFSYSKYIAAKHYKYALEKDSDCVEAMYHIARLFLEIDRIYLLDGGYSCDENMVFTDSRKYIPLLKKSAEQGFVEAQYLLAEYYAMYVKLNSAPCLGDMQDAVKWYKMAAKQNHAGALKRLVDIYKNGRKVPFDSVKPDIEEYKKWNRLLEDNKEKSYSSVGFFNSECSSEFDDLFNEMFDGKLNSNTANSKDVENNSDALNKNKSKRMVRSFQDTLENVINGKDSNYIYNIASIIEDNPNALYHSIGFAKELYKLALKKGNSPESEYRLGRLYLFDESTLAFSGRKVNKIKGFKLILSAAEKGYEPAMAYLCLLGGGPFMFFDELPISQSDKLKWYEKVSKPSCFDEAFKYHYIKIIMKYLASALDSDSSKIDEFYPSNLNSDLYSEANKLYSIGSYKDEYEGGDEISAEEIMLMIEYAYLDLNELPFSNISEEQNNLAKKAISKLTNGNDIIECGVNRFGDLLICGFNVSRWYIINKLSYLELDRFCSIKIKDIVYDLIKNPYNIMGIEYE